MNMNPSNPDFEQDIYDAFARQGMMETLRARITDLKAGRCVVEAPISAETAQQHGFAHAGLGWTIGDSAAGFSAMSLVEKGDGVLTVEMKINLLAPAEGQNLVAEGKVIRHGRRLIVVQSDIYAAGPASRTHIATMLGTMMVMKGKA